MIIYNLSDKDQASFDQNGYIVINKFINNDLAERIKNRFEPIFKGEFATGIEPDEWNWKEGRDPKDHTRQICNAWKCDNIIKEIVCHQTIGKICATLMGWSGARIMQDNLLWKTPGSKSLGFHQDAAYDDWLIPQTMTTCWISLDTAAKKNGTLEYVKGSHKWGLSLPKGEFHAPNDYKKYLNDFAEKNNKIVDIEYVEIPAGGAAFHHGMTWHGSGINITKDDRRAVVSHSIPSNAKFHPTNIGGTARIYKKYKKYESNELDENFFPIIWTKQGYSSKI